jgi:hypothetical protein
MHSFRSEIGRLFGFDAPPMLYGLLHGWQVFATSLQSLAKSSFYARIDVASRE